MENTDIKEMDIEQAEGFVCVGYTALRSPATGEFMPAVPMYIKEENAADAGGLELMDDIGQVLAGKIKQYIEGCKKAGVPV